jgi:predicted nucleic acid-binding protein
MSVSRSTYLDASALIKLAVDEPESDALRVFLRRRRPLVASALVRTEVARAMIAAGEAAVRRGRDVLTRLELIRINDRVLNDAGRLQPLELRSLDAIHLATAALLGDELSAFVTYDDRMAEAARSRGWRVVQPT